jgi:hypothetical protein
MAKMTPEQQKARWGKWYKPPSGIPAYGNKGDSPPGGDGPDRLPGQNFRDARVPLKITPELESLAEAALKRQIAIATGADESIPARDRINANASIMNRIWGMPKQEVEASGKDGGPLAMLELIVKAQALPPPPLPLAAPVDVTALGNPDEPDQEPDQPTDSTTAADGG